MYKNILVPVDPAHPEKHAHALDVARHLADSVNAKISALVIVEPLPSYVANELPEEVRHSADASVKDMLKALVQEHPGVTPVLQHGRPGNVIVDYASANNADCIIVSSHKPDLSDYLLGSTASRVVRHAECAVHVIR